MTMMTIELARTPLHEWHVQHGGRMVDFAGWSMPVQYTSIADEHKATRTAVGVFDISHMGRLHFRGANARQFLDHVVSRRVADLKPNQIRYALICNDDGGILDDVLVYGSVGQDRPIYSMVVNASNTKKIIEWLNEQLSDWSERRSEQGEIAFLDETAASAMIAVQGPKALEVAQPIFERHSDVTPALDLRSLRYYQFARRQSILVSRTGYTGEDGIELICQDDAATEIWNYLIAEATRVGGMAAGLGARDTLRLEAAMPLYGHELSETINPIQAGLSFAVNLKGREFVGRDALVRFAADSSQMVRVGLSLDGRRVPRQGCPVLQNGDVVGDVTSGTFSPTFERPIAMAYVRPSAQVMGTQLAVDIRGTQHAAVVVPLPFYKRGNI
jgi:aminomethyltransferase